MKTFGLSLTLILASSLLFSQEGFTDVSYEMLMVRDYGAGEYGGGASFVDFNQDGWDDVTASAGIDEGMCFYQNNEGTLAPVAPIVVNNSETKQVLWVDYDNDYDLDLFVTSKESNALYQNDGEMNFIDVTEEAGLANPPYQSFCSVWLDYDDDGDLDFCVSYRVSAMNGYLSLYQNNGDATFTEVTNEAGLSGLGNSVLAMTSLDFNKDGLEDMYIGQDFDAGNLLLKNMGDGTFVDIGLESGTKTLNNTMTCTVGDINNDGWMDIYVTNTSPGNSLYINQGDETFLEVSESYNLILYFFTWGAVFFDAENDMDQDLYICGINSTFETNSRMMMNPGNDDPFVLMNTLWGMEDEDNASIGCCIGDFNQDGFSDVFKINKETAHTLWQNDFNENNYIQVHLKAEVSNSMAVGSTIDVHTEDLVQHKRIGCGEGFSSQNSYVQTFGLGSYEWVDSIVVNWPNGLRTVNYDVEVNQLVDIEELLDGCTDPMACNFNSLALQDDNTCAFAEEFYNCEGSCISDIDGDEICDEFEIPGCTDPMACNFDELATDDNSTCSYPIEFYDCFGDCLSDIDNDQVCDELEIFGCQDTEACNFLPESTEEDGSCEYLDEFEIVGTINPILDEVMIYTYPGEGNSSYEWLIENGEIISGQGTSSVEVIWLNEGEGSLSVMENYNEWCSSQWIIFNVNIMTTSVENQIKTDFKIYPNPAHEKLFIEGINNPESMNLLIFDSMGKLLFEIQSLQKDTEIDLGNFTKGIVFLKIVSHNFEYSETILIH